MVKVEENFSDSEETKVDFKSIQSDTKLEPEDESLMDVKQEEIDIKEEVPTTFTYQSDGDVDDNDGVPSVSLQKSAQKHGGIKDDFKCIGSNKSIKIETEDEVLLNIKQEQIDIKDEIPSTSIFQSGGNQDVNNAPSVSFQKTNQKFVSPYKTEREKLYVCNVCDYKSAYKSNLTVHIRSHTGEKPFVCGLCDFKSTQKSYLTIHMRSHTGEKPYTCILCNFRSAQKGNLTIHTRCHTGEKPFACGLCDFKATQKITLVRHMKRHLKH